MYLYTMYNTSYRHVYCGPAHTWIPTGEGFHPLGFIGGHCCQVETTAKLPEKDAPVFFTVAPWACGKTLLRFMKILRGLNIFRLFYGTQKDNIMAKFRGKSSSTKLQSMRNDGEANCFFVCNFVLEAVLYLVAFVARWLPCVCFSEKRAWLCRASNLSFNGTHGLTQGISDSSFAA